MLSTIDSIYLDQTKIILIEGIEETEFQNEDKQSFISSEKLKSTFKLKTHCSKPDLLSIQNTNKLNPILEVIKLYLNILFLYKFRK